MRGPKIRTVNKVMRNTIDEIRGIGGSDIDLKISVLSYSNGCEWMNNVPVSVEDFVWNDLETGGWTNLGAACRELNSKLSRKEYMTTPSLSYAPVIFLLSDGGPTDDYQKAIYELGQNKWFKYSLKVAVAIGKKANLEKMSAFTGDSDAVVTANNSISLANLIRRVTIVSSQITTGHGHPYNYDPDKEKQEELNKCLHQILSENNSDIDDGW